MALVYPERLNPDRDHWRFAGETGRIARSIAQGQGYANPFFSQTGPTVIMTPGYVYLLAVVFKLFGIYTRASALVMLSLNCLLSALTCLPVFFIARRTFGQATAAAAGWMWALFPFSIYFAADFIWPTVATTLLLTLLFWMAQNLETSGAWPLWLSFGALSAVAALIEPIVLAVLPLLGAWVCYRNFRLRQAWIARAAVTSGIFLLGIAPWFIRNYEVFHRAIPFRDNFGLELYIGNNGTTWHWAAPGLHPSAGQEEWKEFQNLGELAYMERKQDQAMTFIREHWGMFLALSARRALYFWTGFWSLSRRYLAEEPFDPVNIPFSTALTVLAFIALWRGFKSRLDGLTPYVIVLVFLPLAYYWTHMQDYYRRPLDPLMVILGASVIARQYQRYKELGQAEREAKEEYAFAATE